MRLVESVEIRAKPEEVFSILANVRKRLELNPNWKVVGVEQVTMGEPKEGTKFRVKLEVGKNIVEYISQWKEYVKNKKIASKTLTGHEVSVTLHLQEIPGGTRLTHEEVFEIPVREEKEEDAPLLRRILNFELTLFRTGGFLLFENHQSQKAKLQENLRNNLRAWLNNIKNYVEAQTWTSPETSLR